jgi:F-type H+-transporting ATPase subunit gamma
VAESLKELRRRVRSVKNIKQITRAMEMVSAAKLRRAQSILMAGRPYAEKLQELLSHVSGSSLVTEHPLFIPREGNRKILVLFTADRGLCGSFNTQVITKTEKMLKADTSSQWELVCIGKRGHDYFRKRRWPIVESILTLSGQPNGAEARRIADYLLQRYGEDTCDQIQLMYTAYISTVVYKPTQEQYLPLTPEGLGLNVEDEGSGYETDYIIEPSPEALFDSLLPRYLSSKLYITMAEVCTSEHSARMIAMNNATKNCTELSDSLTLKLNKARQASITTELLDIVGGAEALNA